MMWCRYSLAQIAYDVVIQVLVSASGAVVEDRSNDRVTRLGYQVPR
jgi:hypothetical protein